MAISLDQITKGRKTKPRKIVIYGPEKIGKSTFAASGPSPVLMGTEAGLDDIDCHKTPEPKTWEEALDIVKFFLDSKHPYKTLGIDSLDWLEPMIWNHVCTVHQKENIEAFGYGKGYTVALEEWRRFVRLLDELRERRGMGVVLVAHAHIKPFANPDGENYDRWEIAIHKKASGLIKQWCSEVFFTNFEQWAVKGDDGRTRGVSTDRRVIHTVHSASHDAGNRLGLPSIISLAGAWDEMQPIGIDQLRHRVRELGGHLTANHQAKLPGLMAKAGDSLEHWRKLIGWCEYHQQKAA